MLTVLKCRCGCLVSKLQKSVPSTGLRFLSSSHFPASNDLITSALKLKKHELGVKQETNSSSPIEEFGTELLINQNCSSCGIKLQNKDPKKVGYFEKLATKHKSRRRNRDFLSSFGKLGQEDRNIVSGGLDLLKEESPDTEETSVRCKRCYNALYHSIYNPEEHVALELEEALEKIPRDANLLHVASIQDYPLSLIRFPGRKVKNVVNKANVFFSNEQNASVRALDYIRDLSIRLTNKPCSIVSAQSRWGLEKLQNSIPGISYLIGYVNTGKTFLVNALTSSGGHKKFKSSAPSPLPAFTREFITFESDTMKLIDVPGLLPAHNIFEHIKPEYINTMVRGRKIPAHQIRNATYTSVTSGHCYTSGGLFFLVPPKNSILRITPIVGLPTAQYRDLEKAINICRDPPEAQLANVCVKPGTMDKLKRYVIPPFQGVIDLVIKDLGFLQIKPTGKKQGEELFEVWAPEGVVMGIREPFAKYTSKSVRKKESFAKDARRGKQQSFIAEIPDYKIFSRLYKIPNDCENAWKEMERQYEEECRNNGGTIEPWNTEKVITNGCNRYWIEKLP